MATFNSALDGAISAVKFSFSASDSSLQVLSAPDQRLTMTFQDRQVNKNIEVSDALRYLNHCHSPSHLHMHLLVSTILTLFFKIIPT